MHWQQRRDVICVCADLRAQGGFTLIEMLLVITVLMIFMASAVFYMSPALQGVQLEEGAARFESMFKFASAEATQTGKRVLVRFESTNDVAGRAIFVAKVATENDPIGNPGVFSDTPRVVWLDQSIEELVSVVSVVHQEVEESDMTEVELDGSGTDMGENGMGGSEEEGYSAILGNVNGVVSETETDTGGNEESDYASNGAEESEVQNVLFYPDGSSDTVVVQLISTEVEDTRVAEVRLNGVTGMVEHEILASTEAEETEAEEDYSEEDRDLVNETISDLMNDMQEETNGVSNVLTP